MKTKITFWQVVCATAALCTLASCEKKAAIEPGAPTAVKADVVLKDGILVFKDRETLRRYNAELNAKGTQYADEWEKSMSFQSVSRIFNEVRLAEDALEKEVIKGKSADELASLRKEPAPHTTLYTKWVNAGVLRVSVEPDGAERLEVNSAHTHYTNVMNTEGLVAFGDTIYQYKGNQIKSTTKGLANLTALKAAIATDPDQQIKVQLASFRYEPTPTKKLSPNRMVQTNATVVTFNDNAYVDAYTSDNRGKD